MSGWMTPYQASVSTTAGYSPIGYSPVPSPGEIFSSHDMCAPTVERELQRIEGQLLSARLIPGHSREKYYLIERLENEKRIIEREIASGFRPVQGTRTFSNRGYLKDWINSPLSSYPSNPTTLPGVRFLERKGVQTLEDGFYAYVWRESDNMIAFVYSGRTKTINNPIPHSYLASGEDVYAAGVFQVVDGDIVNADNASGHYLPDSDSARVDENCNIQTQNPESATLFTTKLKTMGYIKASSIAFLPPSVNFQQQQCWEDQRRNWKPMIP